MNVRKMRRPHRQFCLSRATVQGLPQHVFRLVFYKPDNSHFSTRKCVCACAPCTYNLMGTKGLTFFALWGHLDGPH